MKRICIYPKDIQKVTGKSERYGRDVITKIKTLKNKDKHQLVTIEEFCEFLGLECESVRSLLN